MPEITVVIPTHNRAGLLPTALHGSLGQQDVDHEVVVIDDGSSDGTRQILDDADDPRLRSLHNEHPTGVANARNRGIDEARGEWVAFLDDDDLWSPHKLRRQLDAARARDAVWAYTSAVALDGDRKPLRPMCAPDPDRIERALLETCPIGSPSTVMARTDVLLRVGSFDPSFSALADWDLWIRLSGEGPAAACDEVLAGYVEHDQNMLAGALDSEAVRPEFERLRSKHAAKAAAAGVEFGDIWMAYWVASRHRVAGRRLAAARAYSLTAARRRDAGGAVRALGALFGERAWSRARRLVRGGAEPPSWLDAYGS